MTGTGNQIVGVCRFSYLGKSGFRTLAEAPDRASAILYDPARMRHRFACFEHICLPALAAQTDPDFRLVALIADTMPVRWRKRLKALRDPFPFLEVCTLEAAGPLNATRRAFRRGWDGTSPFLTGFRIDDDDAVARDYIERTRTLADQMLCLGWADADTPAAICFHRGLYWDMARPSADQFWAVTEKEPLGLASAMIATPEATANIYRWNHRRLARHVRCWTDPTGDMFLRTLHGHNDSGRTVPKGATAIPAPQAEALLKDRFGLASARLSSVFADLNGRDA